MKAPSLPAFLLLVSAGAAPGCSTADANDPGARPFKVGVVDRGAIRLLVEETGIVEPERQVVVKSPISGIVARLYAREGDRVRRGQPLARILPDIAQANAFARIRADIAAAEIARDNARQEYDRTRELVASQGVTQSELDARRMAYEQAENSLRAARELQRLIEQSGVTAGDSAQWARITAPGAGVVIGRGVEEGETVVGGTSAFGGGTELFTIADLSSLRVKAAVNEVDIGKVAAGDSVALAVDAFPADTARGIVRLVPPAARLQDRVRVFDVEIAVTGGARILRPGMTANVRIAGPSRTDVVRVPVEAVFLVEGRPTVYRLVNGRPERTAVTLGLGDLSYVEILHGVAPGDSVALEDPAAAAARAANPARR